MFAGRLGRDFSGEGFLSKDENADFITKVELTPKARVEDQFKVGIKPVDNGMVIDHIAKGHSPREIWDRIDSIRRILNLNLRGSHGVFHSADSSKTLKGIISLPDMMGIEEPELRKLAAVSPDCTVNLIENRSVREKYRPRYASKDLQIL